MSVRKLIFVLGVLVNVQIAAQNTNTPVHPAALLTWLDTTSYFFWSYDDLTQSEPVWKGGAGRADLISIVSDTTVPFKPRFLAAEILFARDTSFPQGMDLSMLGRLYASALEKPVTGANEWGKPFEKGKDIYGFIGPNLLRIGSAAVPALAMLLDNERKLYYAGGDKDTEIPNSYQLRIKDFAAFYICELNGWKYRCPKSRLLRNIRINKLKRKLHVH